MKKALKLIKRILIGFVVLLVVIMVGGYIAIKVVVTKDFVATKIEQNINGRVEIKDISVPIWAAFSGITVDGFKIAQRDAEVEKKMDQRTPMKEGSEVIGFKKFNFQVAIGALITSFGKKFELKSLLFTEPKAHVFLAAAGGNNLTALLTKPKTKEDLEKDAAAKAEEAAKNKTVVKKEEDPKKPFDFRELPTEIKMGKIGMEGGTFTITIEKLGQTVIASGVNAYLRDILIDPKDLEHKNFVGLTTQFTLALQESKGGGVKSFKISYDMSGGLKPIDPKTGGINQGIGLRMGLLKGSYVTGLAMFEKLKGQTEMLNRIGIKLNFLAETQTLQNDAYMGITYGGGLVTITEAPTLVTGDFRFGLTSGDFININSMAHHFRGDFSVAAQHTKKIEQDLDKNIAAAVDPAVEKIPAGSIRDQAKAALTPEKIRTSVLAPAYKDGLITFGIDSSGSISSPSVKVIKPEFPSLSNLIQSELKKAVPNMKDLVGAEVDKLKNKAVDEVKNKAADELKKNLPSIPGF